MSLPSTANRCPLKTTSSINTLSCPVHRQSNPSCQFNSTYVNLSTSTRHRAINQPKMLNHQYLRVSYLNPPKSLNLFKFVNVFLLLFPLSSTHYTRIMTLFQFSIISCYQFALINTTFLLSSLIIVSTHHASSYGSRR